MLNLRLTAQAIKFNRGTYKRDVKQVLEEVTLEALRAALPEIVRRIPVWTGQARGTLLPIGRFINQEIPIDPVAKEKGRTPETGEAKASCELTTDGLNPTIHIHVDLFHVRWNEFNGTPTQGPDGWAGFSREAPWHAFEAGRKAFIEYMRKHLKQRMPPIKNYITRTKLKGNPDVS